MKVCVVDDERILRITISDDLQDAGYTVTDFANPIEALEFLQANNVDVVLSDIKMPEMSGIEFLEKIKNTMPEVEVILMTAFASVKSAVKALKLGAFDYITKPFEPVELIGLIDKIKELKNLRQSNLEFKHHFQQKYNPSSYWGKSEVVQKIYESINIVAGSDSTVLITGETGTGKELVANIIHYSSSRSNKPLVKVSCAILSRDVFESELFGHEKGAFTGADKKRIGRFEEAHLGTIYLDDIDDIPMEMQVKLLRVLQESEMERVGSSKQIKIDLRVIASTKKDLRQLVAEGKFREDLFYRLNVFPINLPPLRDRKKDIPLIFKNFLRFHFNYKEFLIADDFFQCLMNYDWPGNTRELKNFVERCVLQASDGKIHSGLIPAEFGIEAHPNDAVDKEENLSLTELLAEVESRVIKKALLKSGGSKLNASKILNIPVTTLKSKIKKLGIE